MFAVIGEWTMAPGLAEAQRAGLEGIVAGVSRLRGFASGWWTRSGDGRDCHTFIVFEDQDSADGFAANVRGNLENQRAAGVENVSLTVEEVTAHAPG